MMLIRELHHILLFIFLIENMKILVLILGIYLIGKNGVLFIQLKQVIIQDQLEDLLILVFPQLEIYLLLLILIKYLQDLFYLLLEILLIVKNIVNNYMLKLKSLRNFMLLMEILSTLTCIMILIKFLLIKLKSFLIVI